MSYNYTIKYRTFGQLLEDISVDFRNLSLENMIEPQQLIKVAKRVNYDLGLRIMQTKETILEVEKGRVKLPDDFYVLNFALLCGHVTVNQSLPQGTNMQEVPFQPTYHTAPPTTDICTPPTVNCQKCGQLEECSCNTCGSCNTNPCGCSHIPTACSTATFDTVNPYGNPCVKPRVFLNCKGDCFELIQVVNSQTITYRLLVPIKILENPQNIDCDCPNLYWNSPNTAWIQGGYLYTNFKHGKVYINYQGMLEDDNGELLVPDHDMLNEYYEYAVKQRILENLVMNDESVGKKLEIVEARLRAARNAAFSIVNTPNFAEMKRVFDMNRKAMYSRYYDMFKTNSNVNLRFKAPTR